MSKHKYVMKLENSALVFPLSIYSYSDMTLLHCDGSLCHHGNAYTDVAKYLLNSISYQLWTARRRFC